MRILSSASFTRIVPLINENYGNLYSRLRMKLSSEEIELFAFPDFPVANMGNWQTDVTAPLQTYKDASALDKERIAIYIEEMKRSILLKIGTNTPYANQIFKVPSEDQIFWYRNDKDQIRVILSQWGFQEVMGGSHVDVIDMILAMPRPLTQVDVVLHVSFSDRQPAAERDFLLTVFNHTQTITTDAMGSYGLGKMYADRVFSIADDMGSSFTFTVEPDKNDYYACFNIKTGYTITVVNQHNEKVPGYSLKVDGANRVTDAGGQVRGDGVLLTRGKVLKVSGPNAPMQEFPLSRDAEANQFVFKMTVAENTSYTIQVIDQNDVVQKRYSLNIDGNKAFTNEEGKVVAHNVAWTEGRSITVGSADAQPEIFALDKEAANNNFTYRITTVPPVVEPEKVIRVKILDYDGSVLPEIEVFIDTRNSGTISAITDRDGYATFKASLLADGEKAKVHFVVPKEKRNK